MPSFALFDLLRLQLYRLVVDEYALALVRFRSPPCPDLRCEMHNNLLVRALQQYTGRLGRACLYTLRNAQLDRMRESDLQIDEFLTFVFGLDSSCRLFDRSTVTNAYKSQNCSVTF